jgi:hypothetical protein
VAISKYSVFGSSADECVGDQNLAPFAMRTQVPFRSDLSPDCIRIDDYGNAVFPHYNREELCGLELKNRGFTGFASGEEIASGGPSRVGR